MPAPWIDIELKDNAFDTAEIEKRRKAASANLRKLREDIGVNQETFAKVMGVSRAALSYYENGSRTPDIDFINMVSIKTECSFDYLLGFCPTMNQDYLDFRYALDLDEKEAERLIELCEYPEFKELFKSASFSEVLLLLACGAYNVVNRQAEPEMVIWKCMKIIERVLNNMLWARIEYLKSCSEDCEQPEDELNMCDAEEEQGNGDRETAEEAVSNPFADFRKRMAKASSRVKADAHGKEA